MSVIYSNSYNNQPPRVSFNWIGESFNLYTQNWGVWALAVFASYLSDLFAQFIISGPVYFSQLPAMLAHQPAPPVPVWASALSILTLPVEIAVRSFFYAGLFVMANKTVRGGTLSFEDILTGGPLFIPFVIYNVIFGIATMAGLVACCVGVLFSSILFFPGFAIVADGDDVGSALNRSFSAMSKDIWNGALFIIVLALLNLAGAVACLVGLLVTWPMICIMSALAYRDMVSPKPGVAYTTPDGAWPPAPSSWPPPPNAVNPPPHGFIGAASPPPPPPTRTDPKEETPPPAEGQQPIEPPQE